MAEAIFSAVIGDVTSRAISLLVGNLKVDQNTEGKLQRICNMLIKINSVVEEAKGKQITNHGTLEWLSELIDGTYQGRYLLDTIGCGEPELEDQNGDEIDKAVESLQSICGDLKEFIMLLQGCQPIHGPLATNIFIEGQMFGRHVEKEMIINFLLHEDHLSTRKLGVLPILGDIVVGKTTLVQHTCDDPRVRCQFTTILLFTFSHTYKMDVQEPTSVLRPKHIIGDAGNSDHPLNDLKKNFFNKRFLIVFEDVDMHKMHMLEELLLNLDCGKQGSKIIVTTNNKHVARIGTVQPIKLKFLLRPEYWFFFKAYAFPGTDVQENPRLVAAGKSIAVKLNGSFFELAKLNNLFLPSPDSFHLSPHSTELLLAKQATFERMLLCKAVLPFYSL
uniref:NB-ARC domain-containing protein n=1 Tax=Leersia perrieri TaxID=77586 RepID=A0A0D9XYZ4_9ORYZ